MTDVSKTTTTKTKRPAAQVEPSRKAAALKAENESKRPQPYWLRRPMPVLESETLPAPPERLSAAHQSQGPPRLLGKGEILTITGVSFPTVWQWMRDGKFPRSRVVGGKSMWLSTEVEAWMATLPVRPLKGDTPLEVA
jgi:predicted DNA-binding transcriptional regulator AlpA